MIWRPLGRVVHRDMNFHFCCQNVKGTLFSVELTYVMMKNHSMSSRGQKLRKSQLHFRERYVQEPLYIPKFEVAQMSTYYIPIDAEFYADFKNV